LSRGRTLVVHGGAGSGKLQRGDRRLRELSNALQEGLAAMGRGSSLDGVVAAVSYMEECGAFNAGKGACLTIEGRVELDAALMSGRGLRGGGVGACTCTYHPVVLAREVMERTEHVIIVGEKCEIVARAAGLSVERLEPSRGALERYWKLKEDVSRAHPKNSEALRAGLGGGTVGAVGIDSEGVPSAAVSTGGTWMKMPGRVGDSAIIGAGVYADESAGAACATGTGEEIIRNSLCWNACSFMKKRTAAEAARMSISLISRRSGRGTAGIITVDRKGRVGFARNTEAMGVAWFDPERNRIQVRT